jgi:hypothetical protein
MSPPTNNEQRVYVEIVTDITTWKSERKDT